MRRSVRPVVLLLTAFALVLTGCGSDAVDEDSAAREGLEIGVDVPDFRLKNQDQWTIELSDYHGERNVILVFYPLAFTPV